MARATQYELGQIVEYVDLVERNDSTAEFPTSKTSKWFCAVTNPNCQARAALGLHQLGYRTFYPKVKRWATHARVRTAREKPLLGRYIFVEVDQPAFDDHGNKTYEPQQSFGEVRGVNGIEGFVSNPDPIKIPTAFVQRLRERYMDGEWDYVRTDYPCPYICYKNEKKPKGELKWRHNSQMPIGARIMVVEGEFADMLATITGRNKNGRLEFKVVDSIRTGVVNECSVRAA